MRILYNCHLCGGSRLANVPKYSKLSQVTSDCRPWPASGELLVCEICGTVQKPPTEAWRAATDKIYETYRIYHQSGGCEQPVFEPFSRLAAPRSVVLIRRWLSEMPLTETGRLLDIGCGNGAWLGAFNRVRPRWVLFGADRNKSFQKAVAAIPGVRRFYGSAPEEISGLFKVISMIHVLEHVVTPVSMLTTLRNKLEPTGLLFVQTPSYEENPFDLLITDHCTHFSFATLETVLNRSGYHVINERGDWIPKELTAVAKSTSGAGEPIPRKSSKDSTKSVGAHVQWLLDVKESAEAIAMKYPSFGLFGTSIAATWLAGELGDLVHFFVDEDEKRIGRTHLSLPVLSPAALPKAAHVFIAQPTRIAGQVSHRLSKTINRGSYHLPPAQP